MLVSLPEQIQSSTYLSDLLVRHADLVDYVGGKRRADVAVLQSEIDALESGKLNLSGDIGVAGEQLRWHKQRFSLLWSIADLSDALEFSVLGRLQSLFAERSIQFALEAAWHSKSISRYFVNKEKSSARESGIFVLALGKLGGRDLNFSSDVDLIAFYDKTPLNVGPMYGASYAVTECLKALTKILSVQTENGFVWRVDWRLRPNASLRNLSMVVEKALDFYHYHARPWHRLAMIKARPIAGNLELGQAFLSDLHSFLWRHSLDYRAIDDIALLKNKINLEHPSLVQQRAQDADSIDQGRGMNLKLGHGGIREIEFIVNAKQLLWGGRKPALRLSNTLEVINALRSEALLDEQDAHDLGEAYRFLRRAENRLQMRENHQDYHLPTDPADLQNYLILWNGIAWQSFSQTLAQHRERVSTVFEALFRDEQAQQDTPDPVNQWARHELDERAQDIVQDWQHGFTAYGLAPGQAASFQPLLDALAEEIGRSACDVSTAIVQIDDYFRRLPPGGQYFRLLRDFPWLLEKLISPLLLSPTMTSLLQQSPHIIDRFLEQQSAEREILDTTIVFSSPEYEYRLANLRRLANEELYLRYSDYFEAKMAPDEFQGQLTRLAEQLLIAALRIACDEMQLETAPIAVIAFGKLGTQGMMPKSDLDLVYLCNSMAEHGLASQFASRLNTIINLPMREGRVYELDTRLRPSGHSGSVTISIDSYTQHQLQRAHTWAHLALVSARFVAGNLEIGAQFPAIKAQILSRPRDRQQFKLDCAKMLKRVRDQRIAEVDINQFSAKLRPGGLFELEYIISSLLVLESIDQPQVAKLNYADMVSELAARRDGEMLRALRFLRNLQLEIRLFGSDETRFGALPEPVLQHVLKTLQCENITQLSVELEHAIKTTHRLIDEFFAGIDWSGLSDWKETGVQWL